MNGRKIARTSDEAYAESQLVSSKGGGMEDDQMAAVLSRLDTIIRLLAHQVAGDHDTLETKAIALASAGMRPKEIAAICGTTAGSVSVRLAVSKRKRRVKGRR